MARRTNLGLIVVCTALVIGSAAPAHAYLDAGTGSMLLQMIVATVAGGLFLLKMYWRRIKAVFTGRPLEEEAAALDARTDGDEY